MSAIGLALRRAADKREPATVLACARIALGASLLFTLWLTASSDAALALWRSPELGGLFALEREHWLFWLLPKNEGDAVACLVALTALSTLLTTAGAGGCVALVVAQQAWVALSALNPQIKGGYDTLLSTGLLVLACSGCTRTLSVDCWIRHRRWTSSVRCLAWPRYALVVQLVLMYGFSGLQKLGVSWTPFGGYSALYYVLGDPTWARMDWGDPRPVALPLAVATAVSWHWEQLSPLLLLHYYYRATPELPGRVRRFALAHDARIPFALTGLALHCGIFALMDVGPFSIVALCYYLALWSPAEWSALGVRRAPG